MPSYAITCPHCHFVIRVENPAKYQDRKVACPKCNQAFRATAVPDVEATKQAAAEHGAAEGGGKNAGQQGKKRRKSSALAGPAVAKVLGWAAAACAGGAAGVALWVILVEATGREWSVMAWVVGLLVGLGMRLAVRNARDVGDVAGQLSLAIGLVAIVVGQWWSLSKLAEETRERIREGITGADVLAVKQIADDIVQERREAGETVIIRSEVRNPDDIDALIQEEEASLSPEQIPADYPAPIWNTAERRFESLPEEEQAGRIERIKDEIAAEDPAVRRGILEATIGGFSLMFIGLGLVTAYLVGRKDEEPEPETELAAVRQEDQQERATAF